MDKPGQDLLVQSLSGMTWLSGDRDGGPVPAGFAVLDITCGNHLVQGILAALVRRGVSGKGAQVEVDLLSSAIDISRPSASSTRCRRAIRAVAPPVGVTPQVRRGSRRR